MIIAGLVSSDKPNVWNKSLLHCRPYDTYHLLSYHQVTTKSSERPFLFIFSQDDFCAAIPFIVSGNRATSTYGYPGPVWRGEMTEDVIFWFQKELEQHLCNLGVSTFETRLNPLFPETNKILEGMFEIRQTGTTVAIDLSALPTVSKGHRYDIRRARRDIAVAQDIGWSELSCFIDGYYETMKRNNADRCYFFSASYFEQLRDLLGSHAHLWVARNKHTGKVVSSAIFLSAVGSCSITYLRRRMVKFALEAQR